MLTNLVLDHIRTMGYYVFATETEVFAHIVAVDRHSGEHFEAKIDDDDVDFLACALAELIGIDLIRMVH